MDVLQHFGVLEVLILLAGMLWPVRNLMSQAQTIHKTDFSLGIFWKENQADIIKGVLASLSAVVLLLAITPEPEMRGVLFRASLFAAGYSPTQEVQGYMARRKINQQQS